MWSLPSGADSLNVLVAGFAAARGDDVIEGALGVDPVEDDGVDDQAERAGLFFLAFPVGLAQLAMAAAADVAARGRGGLG